MSNGTGRIAEAQELSDKLDQVTLKEQGELLQVTPAETIAANKLAVEKAGLEKITAEGGTLNEEQTKRLTELSAADAEKKIEVEKNLSSDEKKKRDDAVAADEKKKADEATRLADEKKKAEESASANVIPKELTALFPDAKEPAQIAEAITLLHQELDEERSANKVVSTLLDANPIFTDVLVGLKNGENIFELLRNALSLEKDQVLPDPQKNPTEYEAVVAKKIEKENAIKARQAKHKEITELTEAATKQADADLAAFAEKRKMSTEDVKTFRQKIVAFVNGDAKTKKLPSDFFERMFVALNSEVEVKRIDDEIKKREAAALLEGKNKGIKETKDAAARTGDGLPGGGGRTSIPATSGDGLDSLRAIVKEERRMGQAVLY